MKQASKRACMNDAVENAMDYVAEEYGSEVESLGFSDVGEGLPQSVRVGYVVIRNRDQASPASVASSVEDQFDVRCETVERSQRDDYTFLMVFPNPD